MEDQECGVDWYGYTPSRYVSPPSRHPHPRHETSPTYYQCGVDWYGYTPSRYVSPPSRHPHPRHETSPTYYSTPSPERPSLTPPHTPLAEPYTPFPNPCTTRTQPSNQSPYQNPNDELSRMIEKLKDELETYERRKREKREKKALSRMIEKLKDELETYERRKREKREKKALQIQMSEKKDAPESSTKLQEELTISSSNASCSSFIVQELEKEGEPEALEEEIGEERTHTLKEIFEEKEPSSEESLPSPNLERGNPFFSQSKDENFDDRKHANDDLVDRHEQNVESYVSNVHDSEFKIKHNLLFELEPSTYNETYWNPLFDENDALNDSMHVSDHDLAMHDVLPSDEISMHSDLCDKFGDTSTFECEDGEEISKGQGGINYFFPHEENDEHVELNKCINECNHYPYPCDDTCIPLCDDNWCDIQEHELECEENDESRSISCDDFSSSNNETLEYEYNENASQSSCDISEHCELYPLDEEHDYYHDEMYEHDAYPMSPAPCHENPSMYEHDSLPLDEENEWHRFTFDPGIHDCATMLVCCDLKEDAMFCVLKMHELKDGCLIMCDSIMLDFFDKHELLRRIETMFMVEVKRKGGLSISLPLDCAKTSLCDSHFDILSMTSLVSHSTSLEVHEHVICEEFASFDSPPPHGQKFEDYRPHAFLEYKFLVCCIEYSWRHVMNFYKLLFMFIMHIGVVMLQQLSVLFL